MICKCGGIMKRTWQYGDGYFEPVETEYTCPCCGTRAYVDYCSITWEDGFKTYKEDLIEGVVNEVNKNTDIKITYNFKDSDVIFKTEYDKYLIPLASIEAGQLKEILTDWAVE